MKRKFYNCNSSICFNQQCLKRKLTPAYAGIKISNTSLACKCTLHKATNMRIRDEIKFLYTKKQQLNYQIYHLHLLLADTWHNTWHYILRTFESKLQKEIQIRYQHLDRKLRILIQTQATYPQQKHSFYQRVINNTDIPFSNCEISLLQKGLKNNLHTKQKN